MFSDIWAEEKNIKYCARTLNVTEQKAKELYIKWRIWYMKEGYKEQNKALNRKKPRRRVLNTQTGIIYESASDAARKTGFKHQNISSYCKGRTKKYKDVWKYVD